MQGKIIKGIAGFYYVYAEDGNTYECRAKGIFRKDKFKPLVGDNVDIAVLDEKELAKIHEKLCNIPKCVDEIENEIKNGIMICGKAEQLCKVGNYKKMKDVLQQISKIIQKIEDCPETILLRPYTIKAQYEVQEKVFQYFNRDAIENEMMDGVLSAK